MLVCLGGLFGSNRRLLALLLSKNRGFHYYDIRAKKLHRQIRDRSSNFREVVQVPTSDRERLHVYRRVIEDFSLISKMHRNVVIDDGFYRTAPRGYFMEAARQYFDRVVFVWVESSDEKALSRFKRMKKFGTIRSVEAAVARRARAERYVESFDTPPLTFPDGVADDAAADRLWELIETSVGAEKHV